MKSIKDFVVENYSILNNEFDVIVIEQFSQFDEECSRWLDDEMLMAQEIMGVTPLTLLMLALSANSITGDIFKGRFG